jgi:hypothetical protein
MWFKGKRIHDFGLKSSMIYQGVQLLITGSSLRKGKRG